MPYKVFARGDHFCVYALDDSGHPDGSTKGCHDTRAKAVRQLRALYANDPHARMTASDRRTAKKKPPLHKESR